MTRRSRLLPWLAYAGFWIGVGLFFALAEWQHYVRYGGRHPWEPFLWELSGSVTAGALAVAIHRWNEWLLARAQLPAIVIAELVDGVLRVDIVATGDAPVEPQGGGTGLANARPRLATLYGDAAGIDLQREDGRTRVRITLPARVKAAA